MLHSLEINIGISCQLWRGELGRNGEDVSIQRSIFSGFEGQVAFHPVEKEEKETGC
jgi:hypothetical protein